MRRLTGMLAVAALLAGGASCRRVDVRTAVIDVPAMGGQACADRIVAALSSVQNIPPSRIRPDLERRVVVVRYDSLRHSLKNLEFTIADAGFDANDVPANAAARDALPPDCR